MIISQIISLSDCVVVSPKCLCLRDAPSGLRASTCVQTRRRRPFQLFRRLVSLLKVAGVTLAGVLLQTSQEAAGLAKQVGASGVGLLTLLWRRSGCGQIVTTHIHTVWLGPNTMVFVCGEC